MAVLPAGKAVAQEETGRTISLGVADVNTFDRATIDSAKVYAGQIGKNYFVDSAHLDTTAWTGELVWIDTLTRVTPMTLSSTGRWMATVDTAGDYDNAFVVVWDSRGLCYMVGGAANAAAGVIAPMALNVGLGDLTGPVIPLMDIHPVVVDQAAHRYTTIIAAVANSEGGDSLRFVDTVRTALTIDINHSLTVDQNGFPFYSSAAVQSAVRLFDTVNVSWYGDGDDTLRTDKTAFSTNALTVLRLTGVNVVSNERVVRATEQASVTIDQAHLKAGAASEAVSLADQSTATIGNVTFEQGRKGIVLESTSTLTIDETTAASRMTGVDTAILANAYTKAGTDRVYRATIRTASLDAQAGDTLYLGFAGFESDSLMSAVRFDLGADTLTGQLVAANADDTLRIVNGVALNIAGAAEGSTGVVEINLDSVGTLVSGAHPLVVKGGTIDTVGGLSAIYLDGGRFDRMGGNILIRGGKYTVQHPDYLAPRTGFMPNTDADTVRFPWKAVPGYKVTFHNWDCAGGDTVIVYNNADNLISPFFTGKSFASMDTLFLAWHTDSVDLSLATYWDGLNDHLTEDITLTAEWRIINYSTEVRYTVLPLLQQLDGTYLADNSVPHMGVATRGEDLVVTAPTYYGFHLQGDTLRYTNFDVAGNDTTFTYMFDRDTFNVHYDLMGGESTRTLDTAYAYGAPIELPSSSLVSRTGHSFLFWFTPYTNMPAYDITIEAHWVYSVFDVVWNGGFVTNYTAEPYTGLTASFTDTLSGQTVDCLLTYTNGDATSNTAVRTGIYTVTASAADTNYHLSDSTVTRLLTIMPAVVSVNGATAELRKTFDATDVAVVTNPGTVAALGNDDLTVSTVAHFDNANPGTGKAIIANYTLGGADLAQYTLARTSDTIATNGEILEPMVIDADYEGSDNGIIADAAGYCGGDEADIAYYLESGNPTDYRLYFDSAARAQGFTDVAWTAIATVGQLDIDVPVDAQAGTYTANMRLRNELGDSSALIAVRFQVNMSKNYVRPLFSDVMAVVDTCGCISDVQWYEDGVYVGDGYYYQAANGTAGHTYHIQATFTDADGNQSTAVTCEQDDLSTLATEQPLAEVSVYPNPVADEATVAISNSTAATHSLRVLNQLGVVVFSASFEGESATVNMADFGRGSYMLSVDGVVVRVIKR